MAEPSSASQRMWAHLALSEKGVGECSFRQLNVSRPHEPSRLPLAIHAQHVRPSAFYCDRTAWTPGSQQAMLASAAAARA